MSAESFKFGDELFFTNEIMIPSIDNKIKTYLYADIFGNIIWNIVLKNYNVPIDFDNCLWTLCPKLSYVDKENKMSKESESNAQGDIKDALPDNDDQDDDDDPANDQSLNSTDKDELKKKLLELERQEKLRELDERVIIENNRNEQIMLSSKGNQILYGTIVQLQHKKTGKFLCVKHSCAKNDKSCLGLDLSDGQSLCHFTVTPKYKVRSEGGLVLLNDEIALSPVDLSLSGYYLHGSPPENDYALNSIKVENYDAYELGF